MRRNTYRERVGECDVDAGLIWVGDPCYVLGSDSSHGPATWSEFCDKLHAIDNPKGPTVAQPLGGGTGFAISSGYGDGTYPVYVEYSDEGSWGKRVKSITIEFLDFEDEDDEWR